MQTLPLHISIVFAAATLLAVIFFYKAAHNSKTTLAVLIGWLLLQAALGLAGFYTDTSSLPPRFAFLILPPIIFIAVLFATRSGRGYLDRLDLKALTLLHVVRIPVEAVLFWLFVQKAVPQLMTFGGHNFDMVSGLTAPLVYYFGFMRKTMGRKGLLFWNFICLALLINVVAIGILAAPSPLQQLAFEQPNVAILYFPFVWLPCCIVPLVALSHFASIRQLLLKKPVTKKENATKAALAPVALP